MKAYALDSKKTRKNKKTWTKENFIVQDMPKYNYEKTITSDSNSDCFLEQSSLCAF
jgi:hypothetical protein